MKRKLFFLILLLVFSLGLSSCNKVEFNVNFIVDGEVYDTVGTSGNEMIKVPQNPTKEGYTFDGWYWDKDVWERPFTANSLLDAPLSSDMSVYAKWEADEPPCQHVDADDNGKCDECDEIYSDGVDVVVCQHRDADDNGECDKCDEAYTDGVDVVCQHRDADDNGECDKCDEAYTDGVDVVCQHRDADDNGECDKCDEAYTDGDEQEAAWWEDITYPETQLRFEMTHCSNDGELSSECDRYLAGERSEGADIDDYVKERNDNAYHYTKVTVLYTYLKDSVEYGWAANIDRIFTQVQNNASTSPDMYCNFMTDMLSTSLKGSFANLYSRVRGTGDQRGVNFIDTYADGYMDDLMSSLTLSLDKIYVVASDYFIDIIRAFLIVPVNRTLFDTIAAKGAIEDLNDDGRTDINDLFVEVENGDWTYSRFAQYCEKVYENSDGNSEKLTLGDTLGFALPGGEGANPLPAAGFIYSSSVKVIHKKWNDTKSDYDYFYPADNAELYALTDALSNLFNQTGILCSDVKDSTQYGTGAGGLNAVRNQFAANKMLFGGIIMLGSLEYPEYQKMKVGDTGGFGVVPVPLYRDRVGEFAEDQYLTHIHVVGRAGGIAHNTKKFAQCTAFLQYQSTHSANVLNEYYDYNLTYDIGDGLDGNITMLQYIRSNVRTSFDRLFEDAIGFFYETVDEDAPNNRWHALICTAKYRMFNMRDKYGSLYSTKQRYLDDLVKEYVKLPD